MPKVALMMGSFLLTFALLCVTWMVSARLLAANQPYAAPTGVASRAPSAGPATPTSTIATPTSPAPTPAMPALSTETPPAQPALPATAEPTSEPETPTPQTFPPEPLATAPRSPVPPSAVIGDSQTIVVGGGAYSASEIPGGGSITDSLGGIVLETTGTASDALVVRYELDPAVLRFGAVIEKVDARVCGHGNGEFWEVSGPVGSTPERYELSKPEADGCWHFTDAPGDDLSVTVSTTRESTLFIEYVEFTVTLGA